MTSGFISKKYKVIYITALLGWMANIFGGLADSILAGIFISEEAVAATGLVTPIYGIVFALSYLISIGFGHMFSYYVGKFDIKKSRVAAGMSLLLSLAVGIVVFGLFVLSKETIFTFFDVGESIEVLAREYYDKVILVTIIAPIQNSLYFMVAEDGAFVATLAADIIAAVINPIISVVFVQIWGISGLAYGSVVTIILMITPTLLHFLSSKNSIKYSFKFDFDILKNALKCGSAMFLISIYIAIIDIVMNKFIIDNIGEIFLPAYAIVNMILSLGEIGAAAIDAAGPFVSVGYGEKNSKIIKKIMGLATKSNLIMSFIVMILFFVVSEYLPALYGIETEEVIDASVYAVRVLAVTFISNGIIYIWTNYFQRVGRELLGNAIGCMYMLITPLCFGIPLGLAFGFKGLVWGMLMTSVLTVIIVVLYIAIRYGWKNVPFIITDNDNEVYTYELKLCTEEIVELNKVIDKELKQAGIENSIINKVELMVEETFNIIIKENKKEVLAECTVIVDDKQVQLITRDNGRIFDITKCDEKVSSLGHYVAAELMSNSNEKIYITSISFNRNCYVWERA